MSRKQPPRNRDLARIHILAGALRLERDVYEAVLWTQGRQHSSAKLDAQGREKVIAHLEGLLKQLKPGHAALSKARQRPKNANTDSRSELAKIEALITDNGLPWSYALAILKRQTKGQKERLEFADVHELVAVVAALHRAALKRLHSELCQTIGEGWAGPAAWLASQLFGFDAQHRSIEKYPEPMSRVLRWWRGELAAFCNWPLVVGHPANCAGCAAAAFMRHNNTKA